MATIRTAIELQDNFTSVLYQVINSVNLGLSAMEDLHQSMNAQVDTSSIEAARDSINQATIAVQELDAAMQGVEAPTIPTPTAPVSTAPVNIPTPQPTQWQSYDGLEVFKNTGVERFEQEVASVNSMLQDLNAAQSRITQTAAESEVLSPQARYDVEAVENRVQALQQSIEQVEQNPLNIGSDSANASLEQLRARLSQTLELQDNLNAAMQGADISQINAAYLQLSQNISETERMVRDSFENIPPVEIPVTWKTDSLEVFTSTGVDRFQQEVQSANNMQAGESGSIQHQKMILQRYADEHHFLNTKFFVDDGFSGVSFEREGLQAMLQEVEAGRVATVITKDLSRLGRNYLKTGELIEIVFPENGVRYIAINDGVDTAREDNEFTPLRNWFNEFYARDTSKKIRAVKQAQAQKGERVNGEYPYGYIPDPNNRHHLIPDPETAPIVKQVFAMFVSGVRMCEIQKWLAENKVLTIGALRYQRTGQARYQRAMIAPYTWPDKTLYDILARQEYLGHTITAKTHKVSYKSKKTRKNEEEQRYFFPNTHEPLVDEETFELAQKRIATRHRPTKAAEIDIFSGLLFCAGCGHKMYYQQGVNIEPRKFSYSCGAWRNRARTGSECTSHYIRKNVLLDLVLEDMRRILRYVKEHEQDFICKATEYGDMEARKALAQQQKELSKAQARMTELDTLFRKLYEDNALGRLTDERFVFLTSGYEDEKKSLAARIDELQQQIATVTERKRDISRFIQIVGKYSDIQELTYENVHEFIDRILIHELDRETNTRKIEIHYSFVGQVDTEQEPTQVVNHDRRNMVDVKSIAI